MAKSNKQWWLLTDQDSLWYLVGLIATDGCLSTDGRHIDITSKHKDFLDKICNKFNLRTKPSRKNNGRNQYSYRIQISSKEFYNFLLSINLTPKKSKTLNKLQIPDRSFHSFVRGVIDGDGSIRRWTHSQNGKEQWMLKISSGSEKFLEWLANKVENLYGLSGALHPKYSGGAFVLKYGKLAAQILLRHCYKKNKLTLNRKYLVAKECFNTKKGWQKSKTVH